MRRELCKIIVCMLLFFFNLHKYTFKWFFFYYSIYYWINLHLYFFNFYTFLNSCSCIYAPYYVHNFYSISKKLRWYVHVDMVHILEAPTQKPQLLVDSQKHAKTLCTSFAAIWCVPIVHCSQKDFLTWCTAFIHRGHYGR